MQICVHRWFQKLWSDKFVILSASPSSPRGDVLRMLGGGSLVPYKLGTMRSLSFALALAFAGNLLADISFVPGHYYSSSNTFTGNVTTTITEWAHGGNQVGTLTLPPSVAFDIHGMAFGQDGLLYAVVGSSFNVWTVLALKSSGDVATTYPLNVYIYGNLSYGKITVAGGYIFVGGQNVLVRYRVGEPNSATTIYSGNQIFGVKMLPNGNLLVAAAYNVTEITVDGTLVRPFPSNTSLGDIRGIAYHAPSNKLFISHLGYTGFNFQVMRFDYTSGIRETNVSHWYADDLLVDEDGNLMVGSRTLPPAKLDRDLNTLNTFGADSQLFIAECPFPPQWQALNVGVDGVHLSWKDPATRSWRVESCDDLETGNWKSLVDLALPDAQGNVQWVDTTNPIPPKRFYRLAPPHAPGARPGSLPRPAYRGPLRENHFTRPANPDADWRGFRMGDR